MELQEWWDFRDIPQVDHICSNINQVKKYQAGGFCETLDDS